MKRKRNLEENEENRKVFHDKIMSMCYNEKRRLKFHEDENGGIMRTPNVVNIQRFSVHDGDGIRTTIFFKGCYLNCWWCHNPESQSFLPEIMINPEKCTGCTACEHVCPNQAVHMEACKQCTDRSKCQTCRKCVDFCVNNAREIVGTQYSVRELVEQVEKDYMFYEESFGGVTLSGGEAMAQDIEYMVELMTKLKRKGFNIAVDTCGYAPQENYERYSLMWIHFYMT